MPQCPHHWSLHASAHCVQLSQMYEPVPWLMQPVLLEPGLLQPELVQPLLMHPGLATPGLMQPW